MGDFFHGWRRKMGCVLLAMSCALTGAWIKSLSVCDTIEIYANRSVYRFVSKAGGIQAPIYYLTGEKGS